MPAACLLSKPPALVPAGDRLERREENGKSSRQQSSPLATRLSSPNLPEYCAWAGGRRPGGRRPLARGSLPALQRRRDDHALHAARKLSARAAPPEGRSPDFQGFPIVLARYRGSTLRHRPVQPISLHTLGEDLPG